VFDGVLPETLEIVWIDDLDDGQRNADLDGEIGQKVASGAQNPTLRIWRAAHRPGIAVSRKDVASDRGQKAMRALMEDGWQVTVRQTGGTAVPQGDGVIHVSYILPRSFHAVTTDAYYRLLCQPFIDWLAEFGIEATTGALPGSYCDGTYNVLVGGKKLIGTAQAWRGGLAGMASRHPGYVLAHACLMVNVDFDWSTNLINRFYQFAGNDYRVDVQTCIDLTDVILHPLLDMTAEDATLWTGRQLCEFFEAYFANRGVEVVRNS
jgi:octanoyl-[GcvH]:protein N-octanoyltransferase